MNAAEAKLNVDLKRAARAYYAAVKARKMSSSMVTQDALDDALANLLDASMAFGEADL